MEIEATDKESKEAISIPRQRQRKEKSCKKKQTFENNFIEILGNRSTLQHDDPDLSFFKSILPTVKKLTDIQKTEFQIEILTYLKKFQQSNSYPVPSPISHFSHCNQASTHQILQPYTCNFPTTSKHYHSHTSSSYYSPSPSASVPNTSHYPPSSPAPSPSATVMTLSPSEDSQFSDVDNILDI